MTRFNDAACRQKLPCLTFIELKKRKKGLETEAVINSTLPVESKNPSERVGNHVPLPNRIALSWFFVLISHLNTRLSNQRG